MHMIIINKEYQMFLILQQLSIVELLKLIFKLFITNYEIKSIRSQSYFIHSHSIKN